MYFGTSIPTIFKGIDCEILCFDLFLNVSNNKTQNTLLLLARVIDTRNSALLLERYEKMSLTHSM